MSGERTWSPMFDVRADDECRRCLRAAERSAALLVQLRHAARALHTALGHTARSFFDCHEGPCRKNADVALGKPRA